MRLVLLLLAALAACAPIRAPATPMPDGRPTAAPFGWLDYCHRHPEDARC